MELLIIGFIIGLIIGAIVGFEYALRLHMNYVRNHLRTLEQINDEMDTIQFERLDE